MTAPRGARRALPARPSKEHLRKTAKRLAKAEGLSLTAAQRRLAADYGFLSWGALMRAVDAARQPRRSALSEAAVRGDAAKVAALLAQGAPVEGEPHERDGPLFLACGSAAPAADRLATARILIEAGAFLRRGGAKGATPLHAAARQGPAALVELLLRNGALFWQSDEEGRRPYDYAREGTPEDRDLLLFLLADGPKISDPDFRTAVAAIQAGDLASLAALLDAHPRLLRERAIEPKIGPTGYFTDPKLFWFVANNPTLVPQSPDNIVAVAKLMIARGVDQADLDYTLGLVTTNGLMPAAQQIALTAALVEAGAVMDEDGFLASLGHRQRAPVAWLVEHGFALTAPIAAGLGRVDALPGLLADATAKVRTDALGMAVINSEREAARLCLEAGADPNRFMACHRHSTPLHQAALDGDVALIELLLAHGARLDIADTLWRGAPLDWAIHGKQAGAEALLRARLTEAG